MNIIVTLKCGSLKVIENVTVAVSLAILEIFSVKKWPDLEIWVWDCSRSLKMDRPYMTVNWSAIVNILYLLPFSSYLTLNNIVTLKFGLEVTRGH